MQGAQAGWLRPRGSVCCAVCRAALKRVIGGSEPHTNWAAVKTCEGALAAPLCSVLAAPATQCRQQHQAQTASHTCASPWLAP
jgi:hypothetical protein